MCDSLDIELLSVPPDWGESHSEARQSRKTRAKPDHTNRQVLEF